MTDFGIHPRTLSDLVDNWDWDGDGTLGQQIQEAAESHNLTQPAPRIIRTVEELEALDHDTLVLDAAGYTVRYGSQVIMWDLPLAIIRDGAEVRAARKALEEE